MAKDNVTLYPNKTLRILKTMSNYYRITAYHPENDYSIIMNSYGRFSADLIKKGFKIIEGSDDTQFFDGNI